MTDIIESNSPSRGNPLGYEKISRLLRRFAIPSIISLLVNSLYNVVDQIFIGQGVGWLGNAATNVAFPFSTISISIALLLGIGTASNFNLRLGAGKKDGAAGFLGNGIVLMMIFGLSLGILISIFLKPMLLAFGATPTVLPYAMTYTRIIAMGLPFLIFTTAFSNLIRADGSPTYSMICMLSGAILNTILDPLFIFGFGWGIAGAAWATVIGQLVSFGLAFRYLFRFKTVKLKKEYFRLKTGRIKAIAALGMASSVNQLAMTAVQITMNNTLTYYGARSPYGSEIPLAVVGVITKVTTILMAFIIGIAQGCQPIFGFNYGARNYARVKKAYWTAVGVSMTITVAAILCFQLFPRQIVSIFGQGSEMYFRFAQRYFRIYLAMMITVGIQPLTATFFTSIGKASRGLFTSLTRQVIFLIPLIIIFPIFFGIDGVMYAGPIADTAALVLTLVFISREMRIMGKDGTKEPA